MANANKRKGDAFEIAETNHCNAAGVAAERTRAGYEKDYGDIHLNPGPSGPRGILQCKNVRTWRLAEWMGELAEQKRHAGAEHAALVVKRPGVGAPGRQYVVLELDDYLEMLRQLGYAAPTAEESA